MPDWTFLEWITVVGVVAGVLAAIAAYAGLFKSGKHNAQKADRGGVNVGGDVGGNVTTQAGQDETTKSDRD